MSEVVELSTQLDEVPEQKFDVNLRRFNSVRLYRYGSFVRSEHSTNPDQKSTVQLASSHIETFLFVRHRVNCIHPSITTLTTVEHHGLSLAARLLHKGFKASTPNNNQQPGTIRLWDR